MKLRKYTEQQLIEAVKTSTSYRQVLQKLNVAAYGGNYQIVKKAISYFSLDDSHFTGQGWLKGKTAGPRRNIEQYLTNSHFINSHKLRLRLISEGIFKHQCSNCKLETWIDKPIPLELDHIDGNNQNNNLVNLRLLCPNCHSQTPTFRRRKS